MSWKNVEERVLCSQDEDYTYWLWDHQGRHRKFNEPWNRLHELPYKYHEVIPRECWWKGTFGQSYDEYSSICNPAFHELVSYLTVGAVNQLLNTWGDRYAAGADVIFNREEYFPVVTRIIPSVAEFMEEYSEWLYVSSLNWGKETEQIPMPHVIDETNRDAKFYMKHLRVCTWLGGAKCHYLGCGHLDYPAMLMQQGSFSPKGSGWQKSYDYSGWFEDNFRRRQLYLDVDSDHRPSHMTQVDYEINKRSCLSMLEQTFRVHPRESYPELEYRFGGKVEENV